MKGNHKYLKRFLTFVLTLAMIITYMPMSMMTAYAAVGGPPEHAKMLQDNRDGTYKLLLNVKGEAEKQPNHTNVVIILDNSGSMAENTGNTEETYTATNQNANNLYGLVNGEYIPLTRVNGWQRTNQGWVNFNNEYYYDYVNINNRGTRYTGQRYSRQVGNQSRMDAAKDAVDSLANALLSYNGADGNPDDTFELALVRFGTTASTVRTPTTHYNTGNDRFDTALSSITANGGGTNWEDALQEAAGVNFGDNDQTFVIFVSDGNPTFRNTRGTTADLPRSDNPQWNNGQYADYYWGLMRGDNYYYNDEGVYGLGSDNPNQVNYSVTSMQRCYDNALDDARSLVADIGANNFFTIGAYGDVSRMQTLTTAAGAPAGNYYSADNTAALQEAIAAIMEQIEMAGFADVEISDGTTNNVSTSSGVVSLLEVDPTSFKYYRAGGTNEDGSVKYDPTKNKFTPIGGTEQNIGVEWKSTDNPAPPTATYTSVADGGKGAVDWDLSELGVLENGVTYTVTFDVYPSQTAYDYLAKIENGDLLYKDLPDEVKEYFDENGQLKTNTTATLSYDDTRTDEAEDSVNYTPPNPVHTEAETMSVSKGWENALDARAVGSIDMTVLMNGETFHEVTLTDPAWSASNIAIATGLMRTRADGTMQILDTGHDFTFAELGSEQYNWELIAPVMHPMIIDGVLHMLIMEDENHKAPADADTYELENYKGETHTYYVAGSGEANLSAYNHRRSNLNLTKAVDGEDADPDQTFEFKVKVKNGKADDPDSTDTDSDNFVWFSIFDTIKGQSVFDADVSGATKAQSTVDSSDSRVSNFHYDESTGLVTYNWNGSSSTTTYKVISVSGTVYTCYTGYYYAPSNAEITADMKAGWNMRFTNLPTGTTYSFEEGTTPANYAYKDTHLKAVYGQSGPTTEDTDADGTFVGNQTTTGTIQNTNTTYTVTFTNEYGLSDIEITKVWDDQDNQDNMRLSATDFKALLVLKANGIDVTEDNADKLTVTDNGDGTYTATWAGLDRYDSGEEINYTVEEKSEVTGYDSPVYKDAEGEVLDGHTVDHGTITNSHTPEVIDIPVEKVWDDADDQDGIRPDSVQVQLYKKVGDGEETAVGDPITLTADTDTAKNWKGTFEDLPKYSGGTEITYSVKEIRTAVLTGTDGPGTYAISETGSAAEGFVVENTHTPEKWSYTVTKAWNDSDDQDGKRPSEITVYLKADGETVDTVTLNEGNKWTYVWNKTLPKYKDGEVINYTAEEKVEGEAWADDYPSKITTDNTDNLSTVIANSRDTDKTSYTVIKSWSDGDDQDGLRPEYIEVQLKADGVVKDTVRLSEDNQWTKIWTDLPVNKVETVESGEATASEGSEESGTDETAGSEDTASTEAAEDETASEAGEGTEEEPTADAAEGNEADPANKDAASDDNSGSDSNDAAKATKSTPIVYSIDEASVPEGYEKSVSTKTEDNVTVITITNTHTPYTTKVGVKKNWNDASNQDGKRPTTATVQLFKKVGSADPVPVKDADGNAYTLTIGSSSDTWKSGWDGLPVNEGGQQITYIVRETLPAGTEYSQTDVTPEGGSVEAETGDSGTVEFTNSYTPETTTITVNKTWDDSNDQDARRAAVDAIVELWKTVTDIATGVTSTTKVGESGKVSASDGWSYTWDSLPVFENGASIVYSVVEVLRQANGYESDTDELTVVANDGSRTITNSYEPEVVDVPVKKVWVDNSNADSTRPSSVTFQLYADGDAVSGKTATLSSTEDADEWTYTFEDLPKNKAGEEIVYTVKEMSSDSAIAEGGKLPGAAGSGAEYAVSYSEDGKTVTNTLATTKASIEATKKLTGREWKDTDSFTFTLAGVSVGGDASKKPPMPASATGNATSANKTVNFGDITFNREGTYVYTVTETDGGIAGIDYDTDPHTVTVTVAKNASGVLEASVSYGEDESLTIENTYTASGSTAPEVTKVLTGRTLENEQFSFILKDSEGKVLQTKKNAAGGKVAFDAISYTEADAGKTFTYTISEVVPDPEPAGYSYDDHEVTVTVNVKDNGDGTLTATPSYTGSTTFTNTYTASGSATPAVTKKLTGRTLENEQFSFILKDSKGEEIETVKNAANGSVTFSAINYTQADAGKTFTYTISEVVPDPKPEGYTYDGHEVTVTVSVTDNGDGTLGTTVGYRGNTEFSNTYEAEGETQLTAKKVLNGRTLEAGEFTFELKDSTGKVIDTKPNAADGTVTFDVLTYTQADVNATTHTGTVTYTISEVNGGKNYFVYDSSSQTVTVSLVDDGEGHITATPDKTGAQVTFTNQYKASGSISINAKKVLEGRTPIEAGQFTFQILDAQGNVVREATNDANGNVEFAAIPYTQADLPKSPISYTVKEVIPEDADGVVKNGYTYDDTEIPVTVTLTDNKQGTITASADKNQAALTFTNEYEATGTLDFSGLKTLRRGNLADQPFEFELVQIEKSFLIFEKETQIDTATADGDAAAEYVAGADTSEAFSFDTITFKKNKDDDQTGEYYYIIREIVPDDAVNADGKKYKDATDAEKAAGGFVKGDYEYDSHEQKITVTVSDNGNGTLKVEKSPAATGKDAEFVNVKRFTDLEITKKLNAFVESNAEEVTLAFEITGGKNADGSDFKAAAGLSFTKAEVLAGTEKSVTVYKVPTDAVISVKEVYASNFKPDNGNPQTAELDEEDGIYKVRFINSYDDNIIYNTGAVNKYTKNDQGKYDPPGSSTANAGGDGPGDQAGN